MWTDAEALERAKYYLNQAGVIWGEELTLHNFKQFYDWVVDVVKDMTPRQREAVPVAWAQRFAALGGDFEQRVKRDPLLLYTPRTPKHQSFHDSNALVRYLISANGIGKTLICLVELIRCATGQGQYKGRRGHAAVVSTGHEGYSKLVFDRKMFYGEDQDPFSPYVPEDGYWFHSFDKRGHTMRLACPECAEAGKPKQCSHTKEINCLSADSGKERLMGFTASLALVDEHIPEDVWNELFQRVIRVNGNLMVAATPLAGVDSWEIQKLYNTWKKHPDTNWRDQKDHSKGRYVDVFQISKYDCIGTHNGPTEESIAMEKATLPASEFRVRVMGEPMPLGDSIFDLNILDTMEEEHCRPAEHGAIDLAEGVAIEDLQFADDIAWTPWPHNSEESYEGTYIWEHPEEDAYYAIGADVASGAGITSRDASVGYVFKLTPDLKLSMVGAHYSFLDPLEYAKEIKKLGIYYNEALVVPEVNSIGSAFLAKLYKELSYSNIFLGEVPAEQIAAGADSRMGVITSMANKPAMIVSLVNYIHSGELVIRDKEAISECRTFQKTRTEAGNYKYQAAGGAHDDRVMAMAMLAWACRVHGEQMASFAMDPQKPQKPNPLSHDRSKRRKKFNF